MRQPSRVPLLRDGYEVRGVHLEQHAPRATASSHRRSDGSAMKKIILFALWSCAAFAQGDKPTGAWLPMHVNWEHAPPSVNPKLETGATTVLYFDENQRFALIRCVVLRAPRHLTISHGDGQEISLGEWDGHLPGQVRYRLVSRTVERIGETLPGPWREEKLAPTQNGYLLFEGERYRRADDLEASIRELLHGTVIASWK